MIPYPALALLIACACACAFGMNRVRVARKQARAAPVIPPPEPREPLDATRPLLCDIRQLPDRGNDERLSVCPVCGMTDPGNLGGEVRGWPAHLDCQEWLGDWKPVFLPGSEFRPMRPAR